VQFPEITLDVVMELVRAHLQLGRGGKPSEEREACTGKAFALLALLQSGRLTSTVICSQLCVILCRTVVNVEMCIYYSRKSVIQTC